jgi:hypothetical protein
VKDGEWEWYGTEKERTEMNNLAAGYPQKVAELKKLYEQKAAQTGGITP